MKNKEFKMLQLFAAETGTTTAADLAPAISVTLPIRRNLVSLKWDSALRPDLAERSVCPESSAADMVKN